jgi:phosphoglycerate dehydrogenase-like enzyme
MRIFVESDPSQGQALQIHDQAVRRALGPRAEKCEIVVNHDPDRMDSLLGDAEIILSNRKFDITHARQQAPGLKWVQVISAGVEAYLKTLPAGVLLTNASGVHAEKGGEFVLAAVLMLNYAIPRFATDKQTAAWAPVFGPTVRGKVATILGVGAIGKGAVAALKQRGVRIIGVTSSGKSDVDMDECVTLADLEQVLPRTDFLISTLPLTTATAGRVGAAQLDMLPRGAGVVVVGRANVFDYTALAERLTDGRLGGAVLDVFPQEPLPKGDSLWQVPNLIMTPHCSLDDHESYIAQCLGIFADNLDLYCAGKPLNNVVSADRGY